MLNVNLLRSKLKAERYSVSSFASAMQLSTPTMARKLSGASDFKVGEVDRAKDLLRLSDLELVEIFFSKK